MNEGVDVAAAQDVAANNEIAERMRVREVLERYLHSLDARDRDALSSCFSTDATARFHAGRAEERSTCGRDAIVDEIFQNQFRVDCSNHTLSNIVIRLKGYRASSITFAVAHLVIGSKVLVRGLRYDDELVKVSGDWRIESRLHTPLWQYDAAAVEPRIAKYTRERALR